MNDGLQRVILDTNVDRMLFVTKIVHRCTRTLLTACVCE